MKCPVKSKKSNKIKKTLYNGLIDHHRSIKKIFKFFIEEKQKLDQLENLKTLVDKIADDYENDLICADMSVDPKADNIEKYLHFHLYQLQNPTPKVQLAYSILTHKNYELLPSCLNSVNLEKLYTKTKNYCLKNLTYLNLRLIKVGFNEFVDSTCAKIEFKSIICDLTFSIIHFESQKLPFFWRLVDFKIKNSEVLDEDFKSEFISIVNGFVYNVIMTGKEALLDLLERYLLYLVIELLKYLFSLEFIKKLKQSSQFEVNFKIIELIEDEVSTSNVIFMNGFSFFTQIKTTFQSHNFFKIEALQEERLQKCVKEFARRNSVFEILWSFNRKLLTISDEFEQKIDFYGVFELKNRNEVLFERNFSEKLSFKNAENVICQIREKFVFSIYSQIIEELSKKDELTACKIRLFAAKKEKDLISSQTDNLKEKFIKELVHNSGTYHKIGVHWRLLIECKNQISLVYFDEALLLTKWAIKPRVKTFEFVLEKPELIKSPIKTLINNLFQFETN